MENKYKANVLRPDVADFSRDAYRTLFLIGERVGLEWLHIKITDDKFVREKGMTEDDIKKVVAEKQGLRLSFHLMVENPCQYLDFCKKYEAKSVTFHVEVCKNQDDFKRLCKLFFDAGFDVGVALKPGTELRPVFEWIAGSSPLIRTVLCMTLEPGRGEYEIRTRGLLNLKSMVDFRESLSLKFEIEAYGAVDETNIEDVAKHGAQSFVVGSALSQARSVDYGVDLLLSSLNRWRP